MEKNIPLNTIELMTILRTEAGDGTIPLLEDEIIQLFRDLPSTYSSGFGTEEIINNNLKYLMANIQWSRYRKILGGILVMRKKIQETGSWFDTTFDQLMSVPWSIQFMFLENTPASAAGTIVNYCPVSPMNMRKIRYDVRNHGLQKSVYIKHSFFQENFNLVVVKDVVVPLLSRDDNKECVCFIPVINIPNIMSTQ